MPMYEFKCGNCGLLYEELIDVIKQRWAECPDCNDVKHMDDREISQGSFKLKGQCWAENGYMRGEK